LLSRCVGKMAINPSTILRTRELSYLTIAFLLTDTFDVIVDIFVGRNFLSENVLFEVNLLLADKVVGTRGRITSCSTIF